MLKGVTQEEMDKLKELSERYAASNNDINALTPEEWEFVKDIGFKILKNN